MNVFTLKVYYCFTKDVRSVKNFVEIDSFLREFRKKDK